MVWFPALPLTDGQVATLVVMTEATLIVVIWRLHRIIQAERQRANQFRSQLVKAVQSAAGNTGLVGALVHSVGAPIAQAIVKRIENPPPPKTPKDVKKNAPKQEQPQEEGVPAQPGTDDVPGGEASPDAPQDDEA